MPLLEALDGRPAVWFETRGDSSNSHIVLLHGFTGTHRTWDSLAERLSRSYFLILPDLPGHGRSGVSSKAAMGVGPTSDAIAEVVKLAEGGAKRKKIVVVGYSLGGRIALDLACKREDLLGCLILEAASPGIERGHDREQRKAQDQALADDIERRGVGWFVDYWQETPIISTQKELAPEAFQGIRRDRLSNSASGLAASLRAAGTGEMQPLWKSLQGLKLPVLLVAGKRDRKYVEIAETMRARIPGSALEEVEGAGHCVHLERPAEFAKIVERFLATRSEMLPAAE
jgi:2-succinyl-6-hydroxy-2,4-cyclohexadiene-1-carboxylate synthase